MKKNNIEFLPENLRVIRIYLQKSQNEMAQALGLKLSTYQSYEEGRAEPALNTMRKISELSGISIDNITEDKISGIIPN